MKIVSPQYKFDTQKMLSRPQPHSSECPLANVKNSTLSQPMCGRLSVEHS